MGRGEKKQPISNRVCYESLLFKKKGKKFFNSQLIFLLFRRNDVTRKLMGVMLIYCHPLHRCRRRATGYQIFLSWRTACSLFRHLCASSSTHAFVLPLPTHPHSRASSVCSCSLSSSATKNRCPLSSYLFFSLLLSSSVRLTRLPPVVSLFASVCSGQREDAKGGVGGMD